MEKYYESKEEFYCPKCRKSIDEWGENVINNGKLHREFECSCGLSGAVTYLLRHIRTDGLANEE